MKSIKIPSEITQGSLGRLCQGKVPNGVKNYWFKTKLKLKRYMYLYVHRSTVYNSQDIKTT